MLATPAMQSLGPPARHGIPCRLWGIPPHLTFTRLRVGFHWGICSILSNSSRCSRATGTARTTSARNTLPSPGRAALDTVAPVSWESREPASTPNSPRGISYGLKCLANKSSQSSFYHCLVYRRKLLYLNHDTMIAFFFFLSSFLAKLNNSANSLMNKHRK